MRRVAGVLAVYLALALVWIYALLDNPDVGDRVNRFGILLSVALVYALLGAAAANWWAVLLPLVTLLLALPAGSNPQGIGGDTDASGLSRCSSCRGRCRRRRSACSRADSHGEHGAHRQLDPLSRSRAAKT